MSAAPSGSPAVRGADSGLELWWWVVTDQKVRPEAVEAGESAPTETAAQPVYRVIEAGEPLEKVLLPYLDRPTPFAEETKQVWKRHGFRLISVPVQDIERVQRALRLTGPVHKQWFGHLTEWTDVVRGPESASPKVIMVGDKVEELRPGRLRLMVRCWVYPAPSSAGGPAAGLRLEMMPQFEPGMTERSRLQIAPVGRETRNVDFPSLLATVSIEKDGVEPDAIIIVPDGPGADWSQERGPEAEEGPAFEMPPSVGEAMLSTPAVRTGRDMVISRSRAVVILIPRLPERFELLGR